MNYPGRIGIPEDGVTVALEAAVTISHATNEITISVGRESLGTWPLNEVFVTPQGEESFLLTLGTDQIVFRPDSPEVRTSFAAAMRSGLSVAERIRELSVNAPALNIQEAPPKQDTPGLPLGTSDGVRKAPNETRAKRLNRAVAKDGKKPEYVDATNQAGASGRGRRFQIGLTVLVVLYAVCSSGGNSTPRPGAQQTALPTVTTSTLPRWTPFDIRGNGDDVVDIDVPGGAAAMLGITHSGSSNFAVVTHGPSGQRLDLLVNEIGRYQGTLPVNMGSGELVAYAEVTADGPWVIRVNPLANAPQFLTSLSGKGDAVVLVASGRGSDRLTLSHNGSSNFAVVSYGSRGRELLVNEIGRYDGTVLLDDRATVLQITADGDWSLSR